MDRTRETINKNIDKSSDKKVLKKMVLMYIRENIDYSINKFENIDKIVEDVVKELISNSSHSKNKTPIYIELPITYDSPEYMNETNGLIRPPSPPPAVRPVTQYFLCINRDSILFRALLTIYNIILEKFNNQETYQRYQALSSVLIELFRVITSSLMIIFVPQRCGNDVCNFQTLIRFDNGLKGFGLMFNFITLSSFFILYCIELWRENRLIKYLDVNPNMPTDIDYISNIMDILPIEKKNKILRSNLYYMYISYITIVIYILNVLISGYIINKAYLSNQTYATFITYIIFMINKLTNSYGVITTEDNIYYSAYLKTNVQFNDIDRVYKNIVDL
jgi:hypothetical protein